MSVPPWLEPLFYGLLILVALVAVALVWVSRIKVTREQLIEEILREDARDRMGRPNPGFCSYLSGASPNPRRARDRHYRAFMRDKSRR